MGISSAAFPVHPSKRASLGRAGADHRPLFEFTASGRNTEHFVRYSPCSVLQLLRKD
jgi:hypothetical protein